MNLIEKDYDDESCPNCGGQLIVHTECTIQDEINDGDAVSCVDCNFKSAISIDSESGEAWVQFDID